MRLSPSIAERRRVKSLRHDGQKASVGGVNHDFASHVILNRRLEKKGESNT
jgi:hypothetical protein